MSFTEKLQLISQIIDLYEYGFLWYLDTYKVYCNIELLNTPEEILEYLQEEFQEYFKNK